MHELGLLMTLTGALTAALFFGYLTHRMTEHMLRKLGATDEQIDRERERVRAELSGGPLDVKPAAA